MGRVRRLWKYGRFSALLLPLLFSACSQPAGFQGKEGPPQSDGTQVPFQNGEPAVSTASAETHTEMEDFSAEKGFPFGNDGNLPVGTLLTVRLRTPVSTESPETSSSFEGVVDDPVTINGATLVPRGSRVAGRVESAQASKVNGRNFVRLTLQSIDLAGKGIPIRTSSLFAHGQATPTPSAIDQGGDSIIHLDKGRRLTFRLTESVFVASQHPPAVR